MQASFSNARHLLCFIDAKENIVKKCASLGIEPKIYINEIFDVKIGETKIKELLDCTKKDFEKQHQKLKKIWETRPNDNKFVRCIAKNKIQHFPDNMLAKVREKCGLGSPPKYYNHNANETISSLIKRAKCRGKLSLKKKQFSCCKRKSEIKKKTSSLLFLEKVKSAFLIVFRMLGRVAGGRGFVCPFLSSPNDLRKRSISKAVQSILRKVFF